jgi:hypothetical protein
LGYAKNVAHGDDNLIPAPTDAAEHMKWKHYRMDNASIAVKRVVKECIVICVRIQGIFMNKDKFNHLIVNGIHSVMCGLSVVNT